MTNRGLRTLVASLTAGLALANASEAYAVDRAKLESQLKTHEGYQMKAYLDTKGNPTVGIGFNLNRSDASNRLARVGADYNAVLAKKQPLTDNQIRTLFYEDVDTAEKDARSLIKSYDSQPEIVQRVVCDMLFNMGKPKFSKFKKTISAIEARDYQTAAKEMKNSDWYAQVGNRSKYLVKQMKSTN